MFRVKVIAFLCVVLAAYANLHAPDFIKPCPINDQECIKKSALIAFPHVVRGIPELGVPNFDPLHMTKTVNGDNGDLKLKFIDMVVEGLSKCEITKIRRPDRLTIHLDLVCPIVASGKYKSKGSLLLIPIEGDDIFKITMKKLALSISSKLKIVNKDGKDYYKIASFDFKYDAVEKVDYNFENLYNGDKAKAAPILDVMNTSWKEIITEIGNPVIKEIITSCIQGLNKLYEHIPCDEFETQ